MLHLNYKHLQYFWVVATEGSIAKASAVLHLTPQTISGQLKLLEEAIGAKIFARAGRNLKLTDTGRLVLSYADEMFRLGTELRDVLEGRTPGTAPVLHVGVSLVIPKLVAYRVLAPALARGDTGRLVCHEAPLESLLADLAVHRLDLVLTDSPLSPALHIRAYSHPLGESGVSFLADRDSAARYRDGFPGSLDGAPMLMPTPSCALRRALEQWFEHEGIRPRTVAELDDRALMKTFGEAGAGVFTSPTAVEDEVLAKYAVAVIGRTQEVRERFYVLSGERRIKHPAVLAITEAARRRLFGA
jgi:LysR family transcriptional activator of nhaA